MPRPFSCFVRHRGRLRHAAAAASAATITVDTKSDAFDGNKCSLRDAIESANQNAKSGGCAKGSGADTIVIPAGNYKLTIAGTDEDANIDGDLDVTSPMTIEGAGSGKTTIDGNGDELEERVLHIIDGDKFTIRDLDRPRRLRRRHRRLRGHLFRLRRGRDEARARPRSSTTSATTAAACRCTAPAS